jgi:glycosyltransferase involved in cell wall biosynthesis
MAWIAIFILVGVAPVLIWAYLLLGRGFFWLARERDDRDVPAAPDAWPDVVAVVPARNEADVIARSIASLLAQDYPGDFRVVLVDDGSSDGTAGIAGAAADATGPARRLDILTGEPLPLGWVGKMWAVSQGVNRANATSPVYLLLTDADIGHAPDNLRRLVAKAETGRLTLDDDLGGAAADSRLRFLL